MQHDLVDRAMDPERLGNHALLNHQDIGHTKQNINAWGKRLKQTIGESKRRELMQAIARAPETLEAPPKDRIELLRDKLSHLGRTVALATIQRSSQCCLLPLQSVTSTKIR